MNTVIEMAEQASLSRQDWWKDDEALERFAEQVREEAQAEEREACAKLFDGKVGQADLRDIAAAIRKRGEA